MELASHLRQRTASHTTRWKLDKEYISFFEAAALLEEAYMHGVKGREKALSTLGLVAKDVYVNKLADARAGTDYSLRQSTSGNLQDIVLRNVFKKNGWKFNGLFYVQINEQNEDCWSMLAPGNMPFHKPELIEHHSKRKYPEYCRDGSVLDFWISNKAVRSTFA